MSTEITNRLLTWQPPARPDWVAQVNAEGRHMDLPSVVPLDSASLRAAAEAHTGLSDYGEPSWREPFEMIVDALQNEADLNLVGRLMCRSEMGHYLQGRLQIEETYRLHPEIDDEIIEKPLIIVGQGRSGTSALLNLLAQDPDNGSAKTWEAILPCPPPELDSYADDPRIERGDALISLWNRVNPELESMHEFAGRVPASCVHFMCYSFRSIWFNMMAQMPSYSAWMIDCDWQPAFDYHKRTLKLLQWRNPRKHWVLKSPTHITQLPTILKTYPDACFVWPHRDPCKAIVSVTDFIGNLMWARSDEVRMLGFEHMTIPDEAVAMLERPIDWLESGVVPHNQLCSVQYRDFIADPVAVVRQIYQHFDIEFTDRALAGMQGYIDDNPRSSRKAHEYDEDAVAAVRAEREKFQRYQTYFGVANEK